MQVTTHVLDHHRGPAHDVIASEQDRPGQETEMVVAVARACRRPPGWSRHDDGRSFRQAKVGIESRGQADSRRPGLRALSPEDWPDGAWSLWPWVTSTDETERRPIAATMASRCGRRKRAGVDHNRSRSPTPAATCWSRPGERAGVGSQDPLDPDAHQGMSMRHQRTHRRPPSA